MHVSLDACFGGAAFPVTTLFVRETSYAESFELQGGATLKTGPRECHAKSAGCFPNAVVLVFRSSAPSAQASFETGILWKLLSTWMVRHCSVESVGHNQRLYLNLLSEESVMRRELRCASVLMFFCTFCFSQNDSTRKCASRRR